MVREKNTNSKGKKNTNSKGKYIIYKAMKHPWSRQLICFVFIFNLI